MRVFDWLGRLALLVLSALATLSLIGSLASVSGGSIGDAVPGRIDQPVPVAEQPPTPAPETFGNAQEVAEPAGNVTASAGTTVAPKPPREENEVARWLKALTYAVLALAGFAAAALLALLRITAHLARIADR